ncbi:FAD-dependent monooxygenase [Streptomyces rimosus]|uniref:FAD-dependent monooxygenase n=1 Tax=Streptomyces rimosus TaxID=1927 RepID=UPI000A7F22D4|nr:FAD-dependent monooxygenase [Streptomyces rimosus]
MDPVIVVGAGPVGLALSLSLARLDVPCVILDEAPGATDPRPARTVVLRPDTTAFLTRLGCGPALDSAGTHWTAWRAVRRRRLLERVEFGPENPSPLHMPQHALTRALRTALAGEPLVRIVADSRLDELKQDAYGVSAHTRGHNGAWWRASYLVGCDGPRSTVRKLLEVRFPGRTAVERHAVAALRTELPWPGEALLHRSPARQGGGGSGGEVTARPLPGGLWRLDWLLPPGRDLVTPDALVARIRDSLAVWGAEAASGGLGAGDGPAGSGAQGPAGSGARVPAGSGDPRVPAVPPYELLDTGVHTVHHRLARRWRRGRAFLAGDAAHLLGALGTQGLDEGLRDAENLAWKLALAWHQGASEALLDSYQAERRGAVTARLRAADRALPLLRDGERGGRWRAVLPGAARGHTAMLTDGHLGRGPLGAPPTYARSPLAPVTDPAGTIPVATPVGAPVADVPVTAPDGSLVPLRTRLGRRLLVVLVAPGTGVWERRHWKSAGVMPRLSKAVAALPMRAEVLVAEAYPGAVAHTVLVVRPDGHLVAAMGGVRPAELYACADAVRGGGAGAGSGGSGVGGADGVGGVGGEGGEGGDTGGRSRMDAERARPGDRPDPYPAPYPDARSGAHPEPPLKPHPESHPEPHPEPHLGSHPEPHLGSHPEPHLGSRLEPRSDRGPESRPPGGPTPVDGTFSQAGGEAPGGAPGNVPRDVPDGVSEAQVRSVGG